MTYNQIITVIVWLTAFSGIGIIKKIEPGMYKAYAVYAIIICIIFTMFVKMNG